jgi:CHAT domain-containing protein
LRRAEVVALAAKLSGGVARSKDAEKREPAVPEPEVSAGPADERPYAHPYYWAGFILVGDPD